MATSSSRRTYDADKVYTLENIWTDSSTTATTIEGTKNLMTNNAILGLQREALDANANTNNATKKEMMNYAFFALRNEIEDAANSGQNCVDIEWNTLIQGYTKSKLEFFLGLKPDSNNPGKYEIWTEPSNNSVLKAILNIINKTNSSASINDIVAVGYLYEVNATYPYAIRLSWRSDSISSTNPMADNVTIPTSYTSNVNDDTNKDIVSAKADYPQFIIDPNTYTFIDDDTARSNSANNQSEASDIAIISTLLQTLNDRINAGSSAGEYYTYVYWSDFPDIYRDAIAGWLINPKSTSNESHTVSDGTLYTAYDYEIVKTASGDNKLDAPNRNPKSLKTKIIIYPDEIAFAKKAQAITLQKTPTDTTNYSDKGILDRLFTGVFAGYKWNWLINAAAKTIDGFVVSWKSSGAQSDANTHRNNYIKETTPEPEDTNIYIDAMTGAEMNAEEGRIAKQIHTKHLIGMAESIQSGLLSAFSTLDDACAITWASIDGAIPKKVYSTFKKTGTVYYTDKIVKPADNSVNPPVAASTIINGSSTGFLGGLAAIFGGYSNFVRVHHIINFSTNTSDKDIDFTIGSAYTNPKFSGNVVSTYSANVFYWDYIYYKNSFGQGKYVDGKAQWDAANSSQVVISSNAPTDANALATKVYALYSKIKNPCGIVIQVGQTSDKMKSVILDYAKTPDPTITLESTTTTSDDSGS